MLYALLEHAWQALWALMSLGLLLTSREATGFGVSRLVLDLLPFVYFLFYLLGGIGLIMLRRRAALLVLLAAAAELIHDITIYNISDRLDSVVELSGRTALHGVFIFSIPAVIAFFSWRIWRQRQGLFVPSSGTRGTPLAAAESASPSGGHHYRYMLLVILVFGMAIPISTGVAVKLYLESLGAATLPWSDFVNVSSLFLLIPFSVWWSIPYLILVYVARNIRTRPLWGLKTYKSRLILISSGIFGGGLGSIGVFVNVFADFDPMILFVPIWLYYMPHLVAGLFVGWLIAKGVEDYSEKRAGHK